MRSDTGRSIIAHSGAIARVCPKILEWQNDILSKEDIERDSTTYPDRILPAGADPWGFGQVEEQVSRFVEGVDL